MNDKQTEALRLAYELEYAAEYDHQTQAAAELRLLHKLNVELVDALQLALETIERQSKSIDQVTGAVIEIGYAALSKASRG